jgi:Family of unknown function (DUF6247)
VRPTDQQWFIEEVTQALAVAAETKDFGLLQDVLQAWTVTVRLQRHPGYEVMIERMQRASVACPWISTSCVALAASAVSCRIERTQSCGSRGMA